MQKYLFPIVLVSLLEGEATLQAQRPAREARHGLTSEEYQKVFDELVGKGYRLVQVHGFAADGQDRYSGIWEKRDGPAWEARHGLTSKQYQKTFDTLVGKGYRLVHVSGYGVNGVDYYAAIWEMRDGPAWEARHGLTSEGYQRVSDDLQAKGYKRIQVSRYSVGGEDRYAAIWEKN
jgi:hypothetical protein